MSWRTPTPFAADWTPWAAHWMETAAEATTVKRKKSAVNEVLGMAVERGHFTHNLLNGSRWTAPQVAAEVDPERITLGGSPRV
ncbi:hypothetical protein [Streptomyces sp. NPDC005953]|uniref:hypothetical protein n=1 Tax=Streptomyces sp. NPDC005953 TaxID=3156719 RepID=UPI0033E4A65E